MKKEFNQLIGQVKKNNPRADLDLIRQAYQLVTKIHRGQKRFSDGSLISHLLRVASLVAEVKLDEQAVAAALLHESIRKGGLTVEFLKKDFGAKVAAYVDTLTKLSQTRLVPNSPELADNLKKTFLLLAKDLPVALIRLADRVENIKTVSSLPPENQAWTALQALNFYAPIAEILGVYYFQWQLQDYGFAVLRPETYRAIEKQLSLDRQEMERALKEMRHRLLKEMAQEKIKPERIFSRAKSTYSIWQKLLRYQKAGKIKDLLVKRIYDQMALMILVKEAADCYQALGIVNKLFTPLSGEFDDYIARPKPNGYRAIHTIVRDEARRVFEIQIRTSQMHEENELGQAAHLYYKKSSQKYLKGVSRQEADWLKRLNDWSKVTVEEVFGEKVFVFTPKGDVYELPAGATPVDFAYAIHTKLGDCCGGARVDGRMVALDYQLKNGQTVEIIPNRTKEKPSRDWLKFVVTQGAKKEIAKHFRRG